MNSTTKTIIGEIHAIAASIFRGRVDGHRHLDGASVTIAEKDAITVETISHPSFNVTHVHIGPHAATRMFTGDHLAFIAWSVLLDANASDDPPHHWFDLVKFPTAYLALRPNMLAGVATNG
ncbi:hypothetical protein A0U87_15250 [Sphingobium sp. MP9-4]|jgi:hypothetical protein|uniref:hypothetical protein n=1 Tax=Sphingobium sp. MP9-4 TaxID=1761936 RepID=UPI0010CA6F90|nr:hypothetical protein [Sphingobium sp. MP9-4]TKV42976.1 hypothetical protein A0U87_15250 [Sphingobium sp. MP9-4]